MDINGLTSRVSVRERLLAAADELFYAEGVQTVGVERVVQRAGASKKSLYAVFGSKEALIAAYLTGRREAIQDHLTQGLAQWENPCDQLLGIFDLLGRWFAAPDYNGCPLLAASAEAVPGGLIEQVHTAYRTWVRALFVDLATEARLAEPDAVAQQLHLLYDAAAVAAKADADLSAAAGARNAASAIIARHATNTERH
jgi:AcrR family transcriptional regulator